MTIVWTIFLRELRAYFDGVLALLIIPIFLGMVGVFSLFFQDVFAAGFIDLRSVFFWMALFFLLLIPALTMRSFAEEKRTGTIEMLATLPISEEQLVIGKFLSALVVVGMALLLSLTYPLSLARLGDLDWGVVLGGYLGLFFMGAALTAIGIAMSASTKSQVIAFLAALTIGLLPFATGYALARVPVDILPVVQYLTFEYHFSTLAKGIIDTRSLIFYGSIVAVFLHFAVFQLEQRRLS
jgi:ABC-2 type transport system permease protein